MWLTPSNYHRTNSNICNYIYHGDVTSIKNVSSAWIIRSRSSQCMLKKCPLYAWSIVKSQLIWWWNIFLTFHLKLHKNNRDTLFNVIWSLRRDICYQAYMILKQVGYFHMLDLDLKQFIYILTLFVLLCPSKQFICFAVIDAW